MTPTRRGLAALTFAIAALTTISAGTDDLPNVACQTYDVPEDVDSTGDTRAAELLELGWHGDPTDRAERLYSPGCR